VQTPMLLLMKYLGEIGAGPAVTTPDTDAAKSLPVFASQIYEIHRATLFEREYSLLLCRGKDRPTPAEVEKHLKLARSALGPNVAFVFLELPTFDRKRLIQRRIPFVVPGRQAYFPVALIDLREKATGGQRLLDEPKERLSAPAQVLVLFHLQSKVNSDEWPLNKWADVLGYSRSTLTRVYKELAATSLCKPVASGRRVTLVFPPQRRELWKFALPYLGSPVRTRSRAKLLDTGLQLHEAGMTAIARLTMIGPGREQVYAMSSAAFEAAREDRRLVQADYPEEGTVQIERWKYAPSLLSPDSQIVDRLSLYLSLQDDRDERTQAALTELLEEMQW
jgi:AraC-like DNA-binding protein